MAEDKIQFLKHLTIKPKKDYISFNKKEAKLACYITYKDGLRMLDKINELVKEVNLLTQILNKK